MHIQDYRQLLLEDIMILNNSTLSDTSLGDIAKPLYDRSNLPERILQFGTGVLLRGMIDPYIDQANRSGIYMGRIAVIKSTAGGELRSFAEQDQLYTLTTKGLRNGQRIDKQEIIGAISRVLSARDQWGEVLKIAESETLETIISNTTEVGIVETQERLSTHPPDSFPTKILAILWHRYQFFGAKAHAKGLTILPTELIDKNGDTLKRIVLTQAANNELPAAFIEWVDQKNYFCNTLVDKIVPGKTQDTSLPYTDNLHIMAEPFSLWAIQAPPHLLASSLRFAQDIDAIQVVDSIEDFKEIKLRLLNGTHTASCALAILAGFPFVRTALANQAFRRFIEELIQEETIPYLLEKGIENEKAQLFASAVIDRFSNPFLDHQWGAIALNFTAKIKMRLLPIIKRKQTKQTKVANLLALGMAAYIVLYRSTNEGGTYKTVNNLTLQDDYAHKLHAYWKDQSMVVQNTLKDCELWDDDLTTLGDFTPQVQHFVDLLQEEGALACLEKLFAPAAASQTS